MENNKKLIFEQLLQEFRDKINENIENQSVIDELIVTLDKICVASARLKDDVLPKLKDNENPSQFFETEVRDQINEILYLTEEVFEEQITELDSMYSQKESINEESNYDTEINQLYNALDNIYTFSLDAMEGDLKQINDNLANDKPVDANIDNLENRIKMINTYNNDLPIFFDELKKSLNK